MTATPSQSAGVAELIEALKAAENTIAEVLGHRATEHDLWGVVVKMQEVRIALATLNASSGEAVAWTFCPECGCDEVRYEEGRHKQCANCGQEYFADLNYLDVVAGNLRRLYAAPTVSPPVAVTDGWQTMETAPTGDEMFIVYCPPDPDFPDGRHMIVRGSILASMRSQKTPSHLQFPATHWKRLDTPETPK